MEYLLVGTVIDSFGLDGSLKIKSSTSKANIRYKKDNKVFLYNPNTNEKNELTVISHRYNAGFDFVKFNEINTKEEALSKKGFEIQVIKDSSVLSNGEYFYTDLEKCSIIDEEGNDIGKVIKVEEFPAQITLRCLSTSKQQFFVPFIKEFIINVDIDNKIITINLMKGML